MNCKFTYKGKRFNSESELLQEIKITDILDSQRSWILDQINSGKLDNATLLYSKKLSDRGLGSHAEALKEVIELLRGNEFDTGLSTESFACEKK